MNPLATHLESAIDGTRFPLPHLHTIHAGRPLWVRYDLAAVGCRLTKERLAARPATLWRYAELLPADLDSPPVSLGEPMSPLLACSRLGRQCGLENLWVKDESQLPTGSFKSRGMALAITLARELGVTHVVLPTAGNAGGAAAAYAARAGLKCCVFMPDDTPAVNQYECALAGATVFLVNGLISDCGRLAEEARQRFGWFNLATLREPYRLEGKKTMGLELAEQMDWQLPDVIVYPTGGGTGLIGMWKAFEELAALGWIDPAKRPRMVAVQSSGCAPIVRAFEQQAQFAEPFANAHTLASGLRVPSAIGDFLMLRAVRESRGLAIAVDEKRIMEWQRQGCAAEGLAFCPETAAGIGAITQLSESGWIQPRERVLLFNTGAAQKYVEAMRVDLPRFDLRQPLDWERIVG